MVGEKSADYGGAMPGGMDLNNWVVLFTRTGSEEKLARLLSGNLKSGEYLPFVPTKEKPYRSKGVIEKIRKPLFPGYLFVQTEISPKLIAESLGQYLKDHKDIYKLLHYGEDAKDVTLREIERLHLERLFNDNFCIDGSMGFIEGDKIIITSGALVGLESQIKRINRHKREAIIEIEMLGALRDITVMLEVVMKV